MNRAAVLALAALFAAGCGDAVREEPQRPAARARPLASVAASPGVSFSPRAEDLLAWAEANYPSLFGGSHGDGVAGPYTYRHYPETGHYVGFSGEQVYLLGPATQQQVVHVGGIAKFSCLVYPGSCDAGQARPENDTFDASALNSCRWFDWSQSGGTSGTGQGLRLQTSAAGTFSSGRVVSQFMLTGDTDVEVQVAAQPGFEQAVDGAAQQYASFGLWADDGNRLLVALARSGNSNVIRVLRVRSSDGQPAFENFPDIPVAASTVRLRVQQSGPQAMLSYAVGAGSWQHAATVESLPQAYVEMTATTVGLSRSVAAVFSGFTVNGGTSSYRHYSRKEQVRRTDYMAGATLGDFMNFRTWGGTWPQPGPLPTLKANGMTWVASDVTLVSAPELDALPPQQWGELAFENRFWRSREIVAQMLKEAAALDFQLYLQLFLTDQAAYFGNQPAPAGWQGLSVEETASRLRTETFSLAQYFKQQGLAIRYYAVGNEIDLGVLGFLPGQRIPTLPGVSTLDVNYLRTHVWPTQATLLQAAMEGIRMADPAAKFVLHPAGLGLPMPSDIVPKAFFRFMHERGLDFEIAALSHPYINNPWRLGEYTTDCWFQRIQETSDYLARLGKKTLIAESNYPRIAGNYPNPPLPEFPFSDAGQAAFVREHLRFGNANRRMAGFLYFYPDYFVGVTQDATTLTTLQYPGLFDASRNPVPALAEFGIGAIVAP